MEALCKQLRDKIKTSKTLQQIFVKIDKDSNSMLCKEEFCKLRVLIKPKPSEKIVPPRLGEAKISFECNLNQIVEIGTGKAGSGFIVIGTVKLFHIDDSILVDGKIDIQKLNPIGRLAGNWYTRPTDNFRIERKIKPKQ